MKKLLVHHHAVAYIDSNGIWVHSVIGRWIIELAVHFQNVGLMLNVSQDKKPEQDTCIANKNVIFHSLGAPGIMWDKIQRTRRIKELCGIIENQYDYLLIRGITPRQGMIWKHTKVIKKFFLLVGSPSYNYNLSSLRSLSDIYHWYMEWYRRLELRTISKNGLIIVNAPHLKQEVREQLSIEAVFVPTNTISKREFSTFHVRSIKKPIRLLFCGRIEVKKGIIEAVKAVGKIIKTGYQVQLDLIGPIIDHKFHQAVKVLIEELKIQDHITFHSRIPFGEELLRYFRESDIFILPSYTEGFPHVIWEAAASCCPVIATSVGGIPSLYKHRYHGILIPPRDYIALSDSILDLISNTTLRAEIVANAFKLVQDYTVENCAKKLANVILS